MTEVMLTTKCGARFIVDEDRADEVYEANWHIACKSKKNQHGYVRGYCKELSSEPLYLHRILVGALPGDHVDHINHDTTDNRISNLRVCTRDQNTQNSRGKKKRKSKFKGVYLDSKRKGFSLKKPWRASIKHNGSVYRLGYFSNEEAAALAYNEKAKELFGEFAFLNEVKCYV